MHARLARMNLKHIAVFTFALPGMLFFSNPAFAEEDIAIPSSSSEIASTTKTELLMFFDEKDLGIATKWTMPLSKAPAIATVITADEIRNMGARNLFDVLKRVPGIGVSINEQPTKMAIESRGIRTKNSEKVLFMIDGHRMNNLIMGEAVNVVGDISLNNIKRVEVIRGPGSALFGANAFIAVINIVTKSAEDAKGVQLTAGAGSFDAQRYNVLAGYDGEKLKATGMIDYFHTHGPRLNIEKDAQTRNDTFFGTSASLAPGKSLDWKQKFDAAVDVMYGDFNFKGRVITTDRGPYIGVGRALNAGTHQNFDQFFMDLIYTKKLSENAAISAKVYADQFNLDLNWQIYPPGTKIGGSAVLRDGYWGRPITKNRTLGIEVSSNITLGSNTMTIGIMAENQKQFDTENITNATYNTVAPLAGGMQNVSSYMNFNKDVSRNLWAMYLQDVWNITKDVALTVGVRHDHYSDFGGTTNPRIGLTAEIIKDLNLKLLFGRAFRAPNFTELYTINNVSEKGTPTLKPETIRTYEAGLEYRFLERITVRTNYFYNTINNMIALDATSANPQPYVNLGGAIIRGIENELLVSLGKGNSGYINYCYQEPKDKKTNRILPDVPTQRINAGINLAVWKHLNANVNYSWVGKRGRALNDGRADLSAQSAVDLALIGKEIARNFEIKASLYNVFNNDYRDPSPFAYRLQIPNDYPTNARTLFLEATYRF